MVPTGLACPIELKVINESQLHSYKPSQIYLICGGDLHRKWIPFPPGKIAFRVRSLFKGEYVARYYGGEIQKVFTGKDVSLRSGFTSSIVKLMAIFEPPPNIRFENDDDEFLSRTFGGLNVVKREREKRARGGRDLKKNTKKVSDAVRPPHARYTG